MFAYEHQKFKSGCMWASEAQKRMHRGHQKLRSGCIVGIRSSEADALWASEAQKKMHRGHRKHKNERLKDLKYFVEPIKK